MAPGYSSLCVSSENVPSLDEPDNMSTLAIMAELRHYGAEILMGANNDRNGLERALAAARRGARDVNAARDLATHQQQGNSDLNFESLLGRLLDDDHHVTAIDLSGCRIGEVGAARLADALTDNTHVRQLWLRGCAIGNEGAKALALCLEQNMSIVDLFLANNDIGDEGLLSISEALATSNSTLVSLEFDDNDVAEDGLDVFIRTLSMNSSLLVASFENNPRLVLDNFKRISIVKEMLAEKRDGLELFDFVVDINADNKSVSNLDASTRFENRSACSSYMPSTSMSAGLTSQARGALANLKESGDRPNANAVKMGSFRFSIYNKANQFRNATKVRVTPKVLRRHKKNPQSASRLLPSQSKNEPLKMAHIRGPSSMATEGTSANGLDSSRSRRIRHNTEYQAVPEVKKRNTWRRHPTRRHTAEMPVPNDALLHNNTIIAESIMYPETQRDFNTVIEQLWRQTETMKRANCIAAKHYRARHLWFWFVPISSTILTVVLLSVASALELAGMFPVIIEDSGYFRLGLGVSCVFFSSVAFGLNLMQSAVGWSSRASVHRSAELELVNVSFRLDKLGKYEGRGLSSGTHSTRARVDAIRELYRIDVYLQTMQQCTPRVPGCLYEMFHALAGKLQRICHNNPHSVTRLMYGGESIVSTGDSNLVPLDVHIDALDLLGQEIEKYFLFPLVLPKAHDVVARTIVSLFARREEGNDDDDIEPSGRPRDEYEDDSTDDSVGRISNNSNQDDSEEEEVTSLSKATLSLPPGWCEGVDPNTGENYYYDRKTGTSSWERPASDEEVAATVTSAAHPVYIPAAEVEVVDESSIANSIRSTDMEMIQENLKEVAAISTAVYVDTPVTEVIAAEDSTDVAEMARGNVKDDCNAQANFASVVDTATSASSLQQQTHNELDKKPERSMDMLTLLSPENFV